MIEFITLLPVEKDGTNEKIELFGHIDIQCRKIIFYYELNSILRLKLDISDFMTSLATCMIKSTDSYTYMVFGCTIENHIRRGIRTGMGEIVCGFQSLIRMSSPNGYDRILFGFEGIEKIFVPNDFRVEYSEDNLISISQRNNISDSYCVYEGVECSLYSFYYGLPDSDCVDINIIQKQFIQLSLREKSDLDTIMRLLRKLKQYIEFLFSQEIKVTSVKLYCSSRICEDEIIVDPLFISNTHIDSINLQRRCWSDEEFFQGYKSWLENYDEYEQVVSIWEKTIYNKQVSSEDLFIWRCQAFELLCQKNKEIWRIANAKRTAKQLYPNLKNCLVAVDEVFENKGFPKCHYSDVKNVRDVLTHNNPDKSVDDIQKKNSYALIECYLVDTISKVMGFRCYRPFFLLVSTRKK